MKVSTKKYVSLWLGIAFCINDSVSFNLVFNKNIPFNANSHSISPGITVCRRVRDIRQGIPELNPPVNLSYLIADLKLTPDGKIKILEFGLVPLQLNTPRI